MIGLQYYLQLQFQYVFYIKYLDSYFISMSNRPTTAPLLQTTAAKVIRNAYYEKLHKVKSLADLQSMIKVIDEMCQCYKINPDFIFWSNEKFENSKLKDYVCV